MFPRGGTGDSQAKRFPGINPGRRLKRENMMAEPKSDPGGGCEVEYKGGRTIPWYSPGGDYEKENMRRQFPDVTQAEDG